MALHTTTMTPDALETFSGKLFLSEYRSRAQDVIRTKITNVMTSERAFEEMWEVSGLGTFALVAEGSPVPFQAPVQGNRRRVVHSKYGSGYRVTEEMRDDDRWDVVGKMAKELIWSGIDHQERLAHAPWNDAFAGASFVTLDGVAPVSTSHTSLNGGGTRSNRLSPDADLAPESIEALLSQASLTTDDQGRFIPFEPTTLLTHPNNKWEALRIFNSTQRPGTADNDTNVLNNIGINFVFSPYLTDTDAWFLIDKKAMTVCWYDRKKMAPSTGVDFDTGDIKTKVTYRASVAWPKFEGVWGSSGA